MSERGMGKTETLPRQLSGTSPSWTSDPLDHLHHRRHTIKQNRCIYMDSCRACRKHQVLKKRKITHSSLKSSNVAAGVKTSSSPITCRDRPRHETGRAQQINSRAEPCREPCPSVAGVFFFFLFYEGH